MAASLEFTASQLQPSLGLLEQALGREVDAVGFALGMMGAAFTMQGLNLIEAAKMMPTEFAEFVARCEAMRGRDVCGARSVMYQSVTCGLDPGHKGKHAAGRLRW
jgi:hypothetical protein